MRSSVLLAPVGVMQSIAMVLGVNLASPQQHLVSVNVNGSRPLAQAALELERQLDLIVTYEDPPYEHADDIEDVTADVRKDGDLSKRVFVPRGGPLTFSYPIPAVAGTEARESAVRALADTYNTQSDSARFQVVASQQYLHIVPTMSRNAAGVLEGRRSLLDVEVSLSVQDKTLMEAVTEFLRQLSAANEMEIGVGTVPVNLMVQAKASIRAENENARVVLQRLLASSNRRLSWQLNRGTGQSPLSVLNLYISPKAP